MGVKVVVKLNFKGEAHGLNIVHSETFGLEFTVLIKLEQADHVCVLQDTIIFSQIQSCYDALHGSRLARLKFGIETFQSFNTHGYTIFLH
jgi:hypothetical protein